MAYRGGRGSRLTHNQSTEQGNKKKVFHRHVLENGQDAELLFAGCLLVLRPFVSALLWSAVLTFASWPIYQRVLRLMGHRRSLAAFVMAFAMIMIVLVPVIIVGATLAENIQDFTASTRRWIENGPPAPPEWLAKLPVVGKKAVDYWQNLASDTSKL